jgi:hypothetical protein
MIPSTGTLTAEVQVINASGPHVLKLRYILSASSHTFTLGRFGVNLVVIYEGKPARFMYELPFLRLYTQLTSALVSMVENKSNTHPSFSHPPQVRKADGCVYFIIVIDVTRSHAASIYKVQHRLTCARYEFRISGVYNGVIAVVSILFCKLAYVKVSHAGYENTSCHIFWIYVLSIILVSQGLEIS